MHTVLINDKFDGAATPWKVTAGTGVLSMTTTAAEFATGTAAMKLTTSTVAAEACESHRYVGGVPNQPIIVFGGRFSIMDEAISNFAFYLGWRDGTNWYRAKLLHVYSTNLWQYDAGGAGSPALTTLLTRDPAEITSRAQWHTFSLVADFENMVHLGLVIDEQNFSSVVGGKALRQGADAATPFYYDFAIETTNLGGSPAAGVIIFDQLYGVAMERDNSKGVRGYLNTANEATAY